MATFLVGILFLVQTQEQDPQFFLERGKQMLETGDYANARSLFHNHLENDPSDPLGWFYVGYTHAAENNYAEAVEPYQTAIRLGLTDFKVYYQLGFSAHKAGSHAVAVEAFYVALEKDASHPDTLYYLGVSLLELENYPASESTLTSLLLQETKWTELARFQRGITRYRHGQTQEADEDFRWVIENTNNESLKDSANKLLQKENAANELGLPGGADSGKPWTIVWFERAGYDSNVQRLPSTSLASQTDEGDSFLTTYLSASLDLLKNDLLEAEVSFLDLSYFDLSEFSTTALLTSLKNEAPLSPDTTFLGSLHAEAYYLDRDALFRRFGARMGARQELTPDVDLEGTVFALSKTFSDSSLQELDALEWGLALDLKVSDLFEGVDARGRYQFRREEADASDRTYTEHRFRLPLQTKAKGPWGGRLEAEMRLRLYDARDRTHAVVREDVRASGRAAVTYRISDQVQLVLEGEAQRNDSTIAVFDYTRWSVGLGAVVVF